MTKEMEKACCGPDGKPDFEKMRVFMTHHDKASRLDTVGWALFFIWVGIAWVADVGLGIGLLGVGLITLGMQGVRKTTGVSVETFWLIVGSLFVLGGIWSLLAIEAPLVPVLLIVVGIALLINAMRSRSTEPRSDSAH
jgi:hypothetical protein